MEKPKEKSNLFEQKEKEVAEKRTEEEDETERIAINEGIFNIQAKIANLKKGKEVAEKRTKEEDETERIAINEAIFKIQTKIANLKKEDAAKKRAADEKEKERAAEIYFQLKKEKMRAQEKNKD